VCGFVGGWGGSSGVVCGCAGSNPRSVVAVPNASFPRTYGGRTNLSSFSSHSDRRARQAKTVLKRSSWERRESRCGTCDTGRSTGERVDSARGRRTKGEQKVPKQILKKDKNHGGKKNRSERVVH